MKHIFYIILLLSAPLFIKPLFGQSREQQKLFNTLARSFGQSKPIPKLEIVNSCKSSAKYIPNDKKIQIDYCLIQLTKTFGKDSLNALAIIMGHELVHYYEQHEWSKEFAYSMLGTKIGETISKNKSDNYEAEADQKGMLQVALSGYQPFEIYKNLIGEIYNKYKLPDNIPGYPTKAERVKIAESVAKKSMEMYPVFMAGVFLSNNDENEFAIECFEKVLKVYQSRDVFNNIAVCKIREVIKNSSKLYLPFILEIEIDPKTRLKKPILRGDDTETEEEKSLKEAIDNLENAIKIDKTYLEAYYNLALCYLLKGKYAIALGKIDEAEMQIPNTIPIKFLMLKSVAYFLNKDQEKALKTMRTITSNNKSIEFNKKIINKGYDFFNSKGELNDWIKINIPKNAINEPLKSNFKATEIKNKYETITFNGNKKIEYQLTNGIMTVNLADGKSSYLLKIKAIDKKDIATIKTNYLKIEDYSDEKITIIEY